VTTLARLLHPRARTHALAASVIATSLIAAIALFSAAPARAVVTVVGGTTVGLQPVNQASYVKGSFEESFNEQTEKLSVAENAGPESFRNPTGYPVVHGANTYAIYWDPTDHYNPDWEHLINTFLQSLGASSGSLASVFAVDTQYTDVTDKPAYYQSSFRVAYSDTHQYPAKGCASPSVLTCLTDAQLQTELKEFIAANGLPKGMGTIYYLLTPPGVTVCVDAAASRCTEFERSKEEVEKNRYESASYQKAICSYHSAINPGESPLGDANTILYGAVPWTAGAAGKGRGSMITGQAAYCQDGGWNPSSKPPMEREKIKLRNAQEQKEFEAKTPEERQQIEELKALQGPHVQEPNQLPCPNLQDGLCDAGLGDLIANQIAVEQQNIVTNPLLNAWQDNKGKEATDECRNVFLRGGMGAGASANPESGAGTLSNQTLNGHNYYLNMAFNLAAFLLPYPGVPCIPGNNLIPEFTSPNTVNNGETVGFDGMESNITLNVAFTYTGGVAVKTYAKYKWEFGDGTSPVEGYAPGAPACETPWLSPCAASVFHSYQYGGTYQVTLTATDTVGNVASVTHPLTVIGPAPPAPAAPAGGGGGSTAAGTSSSPQAQAGGGSASGGGSSSHAIPLASPVAAAAVLSRSLRTSLRKGLVVRYSVNEQVAGNVQVLLDRALAQRLKISGPPAAGLPQGTPPQVVIGKAILVTTSAGRSTVTIQFSKRAAARLGRLHKVTLMLRVFVRNAASRSPATTTVLSSFTLAR
jgi:hypothetical protein